MTAGREQAPPQISDEVVAVAARAEYEHMTKDFAGDPSWDEVEATFRECMLDTARRHLTAVYPLIVAAALASREAEVRRKVAEEIAMRIEYDLELCEGCPDHNRETYRLCARLARESGGAS